MSLSGSKNSGGGGSSSSGGVGPTSNSREPKLDTLDLSNKRLCDLPDEMAEIVMDQVERLALANNAIHTLPRSFASLHRLRYLNIRANSISAFPLMLCEMPRLEILDISKNKLRELPAEPGRLVNLRVLSVAQNRIRKLPTWIASLQHIRVLRIEDNPLHWPPPHVTEAPDPPTSSSTTSEERKVAEAQAHRAWVQTLKSWMLENPNANSSSTSSSDKDHGYARLGHQRGKSSTISIGTAGTSPVSLSRGDSHGPTLAVDTTPVRSTEPPSADSSMTAAPISSPAKDSPERSFRIRPLLLTRVASTSASSASPASRDADSSGEAFRIPSAATSVEGHSDNHSAQALSRTAPQAKSSDGSDFALSPVSPTEPNPSLKNNNTRQAASNSSNILSAFSPSVSHQALESRPSVSSVANATEDTIVSPTSIAPRMHGVPPIADLSDAETRSFSRPRPAPQPPQPPFAAHARNNSHTMASSSVAPNGTSARKKLLKSKKSLPDLRTAGATMSSAVSSQTESASKSLASEAQRQRSRSITGAMTPRPQFHRAAATDTMPARPTLLPAVSSEAMSPRKFSEPDAADLAAAAAAAAAAGAPGMMNRKPSARRVALLEAAGVTPAPGSSSGDSDQQQLNRDSYFKRLSTFPASIYAATTASLSPAIVQTVDATRGILFALSQIYTAIKQYTLFATDERISGQFGRVLDVAGSTLTTLIDALDRFDSLSIRGQMTDDAVEAVLDSCRASVDTFRKVVSVLKLQLKPLLQSGVDVRYTRSLLLMLYGATTEVNNSWRDIVEARKPQRKPTVAPLNVAAAAAVGAASGPSLPVIDESNSPSPTPSASAETPTPTTAATTMRSPVQPRPQRKRQAGSFSAQDVREGAMIVPVPPMTAPANEFHSSTTPSSTPARRGIRRAMNVSDQTHDGGASASARHYHHTASSRSVGDAAQWPPRAVSYATPPVSAPPSHHRHFVSKGQTGRTAGKAIVDEHLLRLVQAVTSTASGVWLALLDHLASAVGPQNGNFSPDGTPTLTPTRPGASQAAPALSIRAVSPSPSSSTGTGVNNAGKRKLLELRSTCLSAAELTRRLQHTLEKVQDEMDANQDGQGNQSHAATTTTANHPATIRVLVVDNGGEARRLLDESMTFARSVTSLLQQIRSVSISQAEMLSVPELKRHLAALTQGCANLSVHLHFCAPEGAGNATLPN